MIPLVKPSIGPDDIESVVSVLAQNEKGMYWLSQGPKVKALEAAIGEHLGRDPAEVVACSSGTAALHLAIEAMELPPRSVIACPSLTFIATVNAISMAGYAPYFLDVDDEAVMVYGDGFDASLPVHHFGIANAWAGDNNPSIIHDACPSFGAEFQGRKLGKTESSLCFSLHALKPLTCGEGGVFVGSRVLADKARRLRSHGVSKSPLERSSESAEKSIQFETYPDIGFNYRMPELSAALALSQLKKLPRLIERRRYVAARYDEAFQYLPVSRVGLLGGNRDAWAAQSYVLRVGTRQCRDGIMARLSEAGVESRRGLMACHREIPYRDVERDKLPRTEAFADTTFRLPIYEMTDAEIGEVIEATKKAVEHA